MDSMDYQMEHGSIPPASTLTSYPQPPGRSHGAVPYTSFAPQYIPWSQRVPGQYPFLDRASRVPFSDTSHNPQGSLPPLRNNLHPIPGSTMDGAVLPLPMQPIPQTGLWWNHAPYQPYIPAVDQQAERMMPTHPIPDESFQLPPMARARAVTNQPRMRAEAPSLNAHTRARNDRPSALQSLNSHQPRYTPQHRQQRQRPNTRWLGTAPSLSIDRRRPRARAELPNPSLYNIHRHSEPGPDLESDIDGQPEARRRRRDTRDTRATHSEDAEFLQTRLQDLRSLIAQQPRRIASKATLQSMRSVDIGVLPEDERTCSICYNEFGTDSPEGINEAPLRLPQCQHVFGDHCIKKWFEDSDSCPYCRDKVPSEPKGTQAAQQFLTMMRLRGQTPMDMPHESLLSLLELSDGMDLYRDSLSPSPSSDSDSAEDLIRQSEHSNMRSRQETHRYHTQTAQPGLRPAATGTLLGPATALPTSNMVGPQPGAASIIPIETPLGLNYGRGGARNVSNNSTSGRGNGARSRRSQTTEVNQVRQSVANETDRVSGSRNTSHQPYLLDSYMG